mmetsp:Transcript_37446/g.106990  ORF Transcript_37446/g.106990 Transcript_37446/m.106990 type:complete len:238 (+) Transcript_37446:155-868(+)
MPGAATGARPMSAPTTRASSRRSLKRVILTMALPNRVPMRMALSMRVHLSTRRANSTTTGPKKRTSVPWLMVLQTSQMADPTRPLTRRNASGAVAVPALSALVGHLPPPRGRGRSDIDRLSRGLGGRCCGHLRDLSDRDPWCITRSWESQGCSGRASQGPGRWPACGPLLGHTPGPWSWRRRGCRGCTAGRWVPGVCRRVALLQGLGRAGRRGYIPRVLAPAQPLCLPQPTLPHGRL